MERELRLPFVKHLLNKLYQAPFLNDTETCLMKQPDSIWNSNTASHVRPTDDHLFAVDIVCVRTAHNKTYKLHTRTLAHWHTRILNYAHNVLDLIDFVARLRLTVAATIKTLNHHITSHHIHTHTNTKKERQKGKEDEVKDVQIWNAITVN